jgi:hypothetical protein
MAAAPAPSPPARAAESPSALAPLAWMSGSWESTQGETTVEEHWTSADGGLMLGMNRTRSRGRAVMFEFLRIVARGDSIFYIAMPRGRGETVFPLVERSEARVVFENPGHDFPQRVIYWREKPGELHARVEGRMNDKPVGEEWVWKRSKLAP